MKYIVIISEHQKGFLISKMVFGPFPSVDDIKKWIEDKFYSQRYHIDIYPMHNPLKENL